MNTLKKIITTIILFFSLFAHSQMQDLATMAAGEMVSFRTIFDNNENLYGYIAFYDQGEINEKMKKLEYVLLDKNLNKIASKFFEAEKIILSYNSFIDRNGNLIINPLLDEKEVSIWTARKLVLPSTLKIDLKTNAITNYVEKCYENNGFINCQPNKSLNESDKETKAEISTKGYANKTLVNKYPNGKAYVKEYKDFEKYKKDNVLKFFDENEKMIWYYEYNALGDKNNTEEIYVKDVDDKALYAIKVITKKDKKAFNVIVLDINSGKILADNPISGLSEETLMRMALSFNVDFNHKMKIYPDKLVFCNINVKDGYKFVGYARMIINKTDYSITTNTISYKDDLKKFIPNLDDLGGVESGYVLVKKDMFFLKDGSVAILTEKYNASLQNNSMKTSDMVYIYTDKDFKIKDVKILKKEKSKNEFTDYLFSQYLNNDENVVFFYKDFQKNDETKDKNWILFINSLVKGEFKQEQVVISSKNDNYFIIPHEAKDGYILLREYNEKEKYNQIRLEKLNF